MSVEYSGGERLCLKTKINQLDNHL